MAAENKGTGSCATLAEAQKREQQQLEAEEVKGRLNATPAHLSGIVPLVPASKGGSAGSMRPTLWRHSQNENPKVLTWRYFEVEDASVKDVSVKDFCQHHDQDLMAEALQEWSEATRPTPDQPPKLVFQHLEDSADTPTFVVQWASENFAATRQSYLALAFFPYEDKSQRSIRLFPRLKDELQYHKHRRTIFRHEVGHVMGLAHEHILDIDSEYVESLTTPYQLTPLDKDSVMHYDNIFGRITKRDLGTELSNFDKLSVRRLYQLDPDQYHAAQE